MEELAQGILKSILRMASITVRFLIWIIWELWFEVVAWFVGWPICRLISLGNYPKEGITDYEQASSLNSFFVSLVGILSLIGLGIFLAELV